MRLWCLITCTLVIVLFNADGHAEQRGLAESITPLGAPIQAPPKVTPPPNWDPASEKAGAPIQAPPKVTPPPSLDPASTPSNDLCRNLSPDERKKIASCQDN